MRTTLLATLLIAAAAVSAPAFAHEGPGPNGGLVFGKDEAHETELVVTPTDLTVYLLENGKAESTKGASLKAVVQNGGSTSAVELADSGNTKFVGKLAAPLGAGAVVVLTGKDEHGHAITSRYVLK